VDEEYLINLVRQNDVGLSLRIQNGLCSPVEVAAGLAAGSASLQADALDFLGDAGNYAISLFVVSMALRYRAMAAFLKGATMGVFGLWVLGITAWHVVHGTLPHAATMGAVGVAALVANAASFGLLRAYRAGDANAFGLDLHAQRRFWKSRGATCGPWGVRDGHRLA
jgi:Co/Zn/Cd efflux system component